MTPADARVRQEPGDDRPADALASRTLCEAFQTTAAERPSDIALRRHDGTRELTWEEYQQTVRSVAGGLTGLGVERGDTVGLMLVNRPGFHVADCAAMHLGATTFSIYNTSPRDDIAYVVEDAQPKVVVTEEQFVERLLAAGVERDQLVVVDGQPSLTDIARSTPEDFDFDATWRQVRPDDPLVLIYTSGTTGPPKAVELTHANLLAQARGLHAGLPLPAGGRVISYFPMAHIAERNTSHYVPMALGQTVTSCPDPRQVIALLPGVRPTGFFGAPRIWEKLKSAIEPQLDPRTRAAVDLGLEVVGLEQAGLPVGDALRARRRDADVLLAPIRQRLGLDDLDWVVTGSAPTPREVVEFFHALGIPVADVWGLSETSAVATANPAGRIRIGTVGVPVPGVEIAFASDGEVLVRGPIVMAGYRNAPEATRAAIDDEGWFSTGDIGELDGEGYLRIVDRKKELIINAAGKNMSPANIEARVKTSSPVISQCAAIGDGRPYNVALITIDPDGAAAFARANGIASADVADLARQPDVHEEVRTAVERANAHLARVEQIKRFHIVDADWQPGSDELTPTMKLKRRVIQEKYAADITALYEIP